MKFGDATVKIAKITKITDENYRIKTFEFDTSVASTPGQFAMLWIPGIGERPFDIAKNNPLSFTIAKVGEFSSAMHKLKVGDSISFRGPFGNPFFIQGKKIALVGGGYGVVTLYSLAKLALAKKITVTAIIGARNEKDIIYEKQMKALGCEVAVSTDDGSMGFKGNAVQCFEEHNKKHKFDAVYACGPEMMLYYLSKKCVEFQIPCQVSIERYMKCGFGICGSCDMNGKTICIDGPVLDAKEALKCEEFGKFHRGASGKKTTF